MGNHFPVLDGRPPSPSLTLPLLPPGICNRCVHRFDHLCIWTNNCVGGGNLRWFLLYLWTLVAMVTNGAMQAARALSLMVGKLRLMEAGYVHPDTGALVPVNIPVLVQVI